jgi:hypothetical protein
LARTPRDRGLEIAVSDRTEAATSRFPLIDLEIWLSSARIAE